LDGLRKSESRGPPNRHITGATTGVLSASTKRKRSSRRAVARARRPAGRISALPFPKLRHSPHSFSSLLCWFWGLGVRGGGGRKTLAFGPPALGPKKSKPFLGAPRPRNEKPGAVSRAGLGHTPEGYLFIHEFRFNVQKSEVEVTSCTEVRSCTTHRFYSASQDIHCSWPGLVSPRPESP
jgi:hypothetical protein